MITRWRRLLPALAVLALASASVAQTLTVYSGRNEAFVGPVVDWFEQETGSNMQVRYGDTASLAATILEEGRNTPADIYLGQDAGALGALAGTGMFAQLPDELLDLVEPRFRSPDGLWIGITGRARVLAYSTERVEAGALPESVFDLSEESWRGRVGWAPTNGSFQAFVTAMRIVHGEDATRDWLESLLRNGVQEYPNNSSMVEAVARGEIDLALTNHYYLFRFLAERGEDFPVGNHYLADADIGSLINVAGAGILATSDNADAAAVFLSFLLSERAQGHFTESVFEYPLAQGVAANPRLLDLGAIETPELDLSRLEGLQETLELLMDVGAL